MKIRLSIKISDELVKEDGIEIEDHKIEDLSEDELREAIEINIRQWVDDHVHVHWEVQDDSE